MWAASLKSSRIFTPLLIIAILDIEVIKPLL